ncbi:type II toxin-antitoxin system HicB family antitoxin [Bradyrhizobium liaoningense]|uniref:type II toxin-antitoxin system HicB family antitoxin n=1 Tax=Bradyrhizobium liaoningense TaxID=43992 RepID=UPI001BA9919E|nr:type II toxin-antitoxin system HicB family antitoxin [Bradyrhizobium liaoningense]MBR0735780.1 type II toxin-antitoxin system HicB family antitoxin [Bradyrhizobium liaoningense]
MADVAKYTTRIAYSAEDEGYIATVPELPGCSAFGATAAEALNEIGSAIEAWISATEAAGNPVPPPSQLEHELPSGKFLVRVAKTVHAQLTAAAQREGISLNQYVGTLLSTATLENIYSRATTSGSYGYSAEIQNRTSVDVATRNVETGYLTKIVAHDHAVVSTLGGVKYLEIKNYPLRTGAGGMVFSGFKKPGSKSARRTKVPTHG